MDKPRNDAELRVGGRVEVSDSQDDFFRQVGKITSVGDATCHVEFEGYYVEYFPNQLTPVD